ncbi:MAG TPA: hypothetical protein VFL95_05725 [Gemmatimonadales bacterium]|nr:hypothetical protein [Gemmatimonadales bacterium]
MNPHLELEQLLALREPGAEPGDAALRDHLASCAECRAEAERLDQLQARLRALPVLRPTRDRWPAVRARLAADRRRVWWRRAGLASAGMAAALAGLILGNSFRSATPPDAAGVTGAAAEIARAKESSQALEQLLQQYDPDSRIIDGRTDRIAQELENRIAAVDRELQQTAAADEAERNAAALRLWRERVGLLDALVDVHVTRASNVGL